MRKVLLIAAVAALAGPACAQTWWMGAANPAGVTFIDFDRITTDAQGRRSVIERMLTPQETAINGKPVAVIVAHQAYDCAAGTSRFLGGNATTEKAEVVIRIPADTEDRTPGPDTDGWRVMKLVCAGSDTERSLYGRFFGEVDFDGLVARWRPAPRKRGG